MTNPANPRKKQVRNHIKFALACALFVGLLVLVEHQVGWGKLLQPWLTLSWLQIAVALLLVFVSYAIRALRLLYYFPDLLKPHFPAVMRVMLQHNFYNNILPMRSGELSFPLLMHQLFRLPSATSVAALLWFRVLDLCTLLSAGLIAFLLSQWGWELAGLALAAILLGLWGLYYLQHHGLNLIIQQSPERLQPLLEKLQLGMPADGPHYLGVIFWTTSNWLVKLGAFCWVFMQFLPDISIAESLMGVMGGELTAVSPVHGFAGVGTYEAGIIAVLKPMGWSLEGILTAAVNLHLFLLSSTLLSFIVSWGLPKPKLEN